MIEPELRCPAPRPAHLRVGFRRRFATALVLFVIAGALPVAVAAHRLWAIQVLQADGLPVRATVARRLPSSLLSLRPTRLECVYVGASGKLETRRVSAPATWWKASPPGSTVTITVSDATPGLAALGAPSEVHMGTEIGWTAWTLLLLGMGVLVRAGMRLRPYFRDLTLVSLGTPVTGRVVGKSWKPALRWGRLRPLPMIHLYFKDPYGVERVRTQVVSGAAWARASEGQTMTVLFCARRRGWFGAYPLLMAEGARASVPLFAGAPEPDPASVPAASA